MKESKIRILGTIAAISAIPAGILALVVLVQMVPKLWQHELRAEARYGSFALPPALFKHNAQHAKALSEAAIDSSFASLDSLAETKAERQIVMGARLRTLNLTQYIDWSIPYDARKLEGYWEFSIFNSATHKLVNVTLNVPGGAAARIVRTGQDSVVIDSSSMYQVGDMAPNARVSVFVWTSVPPVFFDSDDLALTYDDGVGTIKILKPVGRIGQFADSFFSSLILLGWLVFILLWAAVSIYSPSRGASKGNSPNSDSSAGDAP
jgi:hypothetical protein